ncbi:unnamed protein product [Effrenium voratum]|nr:unnamed protein product [Effrenium voratum]
MKRVEASASLRGKLRDMAMEWAKGTDRAVVVAAVHALAALGAGSAEFKELWPSLKRVKGAPAASACLLEHASEEVFPLIFPSSSLSSALAGLLVLAPPSADAARRLALLALRGAPGSDAAQRVAQAPEALRPLLVQQLLLLSDSLPSEGSPHGEAHGQHLRYWLCLGELLSAGDAFSAASAAQRALRAPLLPATRVLVQNVWAKAAFLAGDAVILPLAELLQDFELPEAFAFNALSVAAQLLLHPQRGQPCRDGQALQLQATSHAELQLLGALVAWSACYIHGPRLLASLALFAAMERGLLTETPGWYVDALHRQVRDASAFQKLRARVRLDEWISDVWSEAKPRRPLDVMLTTATKQVAQDFWSPAPEEENEEGGEGAIQRRPERPPRGTSEDIDVVVCASLVDNVPNMAGLVRTSEALLGGRVEVALRNEKVLQEASFQKMVVAADKNIRLSSVPCGPRLLAFLREHRSLGKEVIALEQTSSSQILQADLQLPKRFLLLLGNEQEGLPAWLLQSGLVDRCIELPLRGCTASLNVHVAAAMLLWHYRLHH